MSLLTEPGQKVSSAPVPVMLLTLALSLGGAKEAANWALIVGRKITPLVFQCTEKDEICRRVLDHCSLIAELITINDTSHFQVSRNRESGMPCNK